MANKNRSKKKLRSPVKPKRRSLRTAGLLVVLVVAAALFLFLGGVQGFGDYMASNAVARWDQPAAEKWLGVSEWFGGSSGQSQFLRARLARRNGELEPMQALLQQAGDSGYSRDKITKELLLARAQIGQLDSSEEQLAALLQVGDPDSRDICSSYANGLAIAGRIDEATAVLNAWAGDFASDPRPHFRLGRLSEHQQSYDAAEEHYQKALILDPEYLPALFSMGRMLSNRSRIPEAKVYFEKCLNSPNPIAAKIGLARCLKATDNVEQAKAMLEEAIAVSPDVLAASYRQFDELFDPMAAYIELGKIETDLGHYAEAAELLGKSLAANPRDNVIRYSYATALRGLGRTEEAQLEFEKVRVARAELAKATLLVERVAKNPADVEARIELGKIHLEFDSEQRGLFWFRTVLAVDPDNRETHRILSDFFDEKSKEDNSYAELAAEHRRLAEANTNAKE